MKVSNISLNPVEFLWKLVVVLLLVVPVCIGGIVFLSLFLMDFHVKTWIEIITVVLAAGLGTCLSFGLTMGVIKLVIRRYQMDNVFIGIALSVMAVVIGVVVAISMVMWVLIAFC